MQKFVSKKGRLDTHAAPMQWTDVWTLTF